MSRRIGTRATVWSAVLLLAAVLFAGGMIRTVFSPLQEAAKLDLKLSDFAISLVQGLATGAPIALVSIPLAWVIDHGNRVRLLVALLAISVIGALWTAFATGLLSLFLARMLSALGASCAIPVIISLVADLCAPEKRGAAIVVLGLGAYAGAAAAFVLAGLLLPALARHPIAALGAMAPWRETHLLLGLAGTLMLFLLFLLREPQRHEVELQTTSLGPTMRALWGKRAFLFPLFAGQIGVSMADAAAGVWATPVLIPQLSSAAGRVCRVGGRDPVCRRRPRLGPWRVRRRPWPQDRPSRRPPVGRCSRHRPGHSHRPCSRSCPALAGFS